MLGIFDSGLGGLTSVKEIKKLLPNESLIYFGDTGRVPYGSRSAETIKKYALQDTRFLLSHEVDAILVACGTVSSTALDELKAKFSLPIIGVVEAACESAVNVSKNKKIAVIGTAATVKSGAYEKKIRELSAEAEVISVPCPLFVPLVENGFTEEDSTVTRLVAEQYLEPVLKSGADTLIMGCTHYPMIEKIIAKVLPGVELINTGKEAARKFGELLKEKGLLKSETEPKRLYFVSDEPSSFEKNASLFLGENISGKLQKTDIDKY
ncbi:MAG: glutamate racemase [Ruminococcaceae bacterium]|nr:glutamate racemase [Oscillospiraceae bacterium]